MIFDPWGRKFPIDYDYRFNILSVSYYLIKNYHFDDTEIMSIHVIFYIDELKRLV